MKKVLLTSLSICLFLSGVVFLPAHALHCQAETSEENDLASVAESDKGLSAEDTRNMAPCISWTNPQVKPCVLLLCIHGLGLYSGSYKDFGMHMARLGIATYAIDVRGFGSWMKSGGKQEVDFQGCLEDIRTAIVAIRAANPGLPLFLLGESMGGAIALRFASEHPELIDGLVSSVPSGSRFQQKKTDLRVALDFLKGPNREYDLGEGVVNQATENTKLRKDWENNPLDRMDLSPKDLLHFQRFMNENHDAAKNVTALPVLFVQGMEDRLIKPEGTWELFNKLTTTNKYFVALPSEHLIFEETQDDPAERKLNNFRLLMSWILTEAHVTLKLADDVDQSVLSNAITMMLTNNFDGARAVLQGLTAVQPRNTLAHYFLGQAYLKTEQPALAKAEFMKAVDLARGSKLASQANDYLLNLSNGGAAAAGNGSDLADIPTTPELTRGKVTILAFFATWAAQCDQLDAWFTKGKAMFGDQVQFKKLDVDEEANKPLVKRFKIGPIPTIVILRADGKFTSAIIGQTSFGNIADAVTPLVKKSLPK